MWHYTPDLARVPGLAIPIQCPLAQPAHNLDLCCEKGCGTPSQRPDKGQPLLSACPQTKLFHTGEGGKAGLTLDKPTLTVHNCPFSFKCPEMLLWEDSAYGLTWDRPCRELPSATLGQQHLGHTFPRRSFNYIHTYIYSWTWPVQLWNQIQNSERLKWVIKSFVNCWKLLLH